MFNDAKIYIILIKAKCFLKQKKNEVVGFIVPITSFGFYAYLLFKSSTMENFNTSWWIIEFIPYLILIST